jgi:hypothetical protein
VRVIYPDAEVTFTGFPLKGFARSRALLRRRKSPIRSTRFFIRPPDMVERWGRRREQK